MKDVQQHPSRTMGPEEDTDANRLRHLELLFGGLAISTLGTLAAAGITYAIMRSEIPGTTLDTWLVVVVVIGLGRLITGTLYRHGVFDGLDIDARYTIFWAGAALAGFGWGLSGLALFPDDVTLQMFLAFVLAGVAAGAVSTLATDWRSLKIFLPLAILPMTVQLFSLGTQMGTAMGTLILLYLGAGLASGKRTNIITLSALAAEFSHRESQRELARIARTTQDGFWTWPDIDSDYLWWSDRMFLMLGLEPDSVEASMTQWRNLIHPDDQPAFFAEMSAGILDERPFEIEFRIKNASGDYVWMLNRAVVEFSENGHATGMSGAVSDIDELVAEKQTAARSLADLEAYKEVIDHHSIVAITDRAGRIVHVNDGFVELSKFSREELIGQTHRIVNGGYHPQRFWKNMWETVTSGEIWHGEVCNTAKDGSIYWLKASIMPLLDSEGEIDGFIALRTDITETKEYEKELLNLMHDAESGRTAQSNFLSTMSHEIRTPLNGVIGMAGLLADTELDDEQKDFVRTIMGSGESLLSIINDILDFSKIEAGHLQLDPIPFNLEFTTTEALDVFTAKIREKGLDLELRYAPGTPTEVIGDPGRIRQILLNLVGNALKFTSEGLIRVDLEELESQGENTLIRFSVQDTGIGVTKDQAKMLFHPFKQADQTTSRKFGGTGLGLAICKQLAEAMGGEVGVESVPGEGSTFWFTAKFRKSHERTHVELLAEVENSKVLIVDDDPSSCALVEELLESWKVRATTTTTGEDGIVQMRRAAADNQPFDVAIIDYRMPEMDGEEMGLIIREDKEINSTRLIMLTASTRRGDSLRFKNAGYAAYLTKPIAPTILKKTIAALMIPDAHPTRLVTRHSIAEASSVMLRRKDDKVTLSIKILVVDDNMVNQKVAKKILEKIGCEVDLAENGQVALDRMKETNYDQIYMDCQMPVMDGFETTRNIRISEKANGVPRIPIIAMTANAMESDRKNCLDAGMDEFLSKPVKPKDLEAMVRSQMPVVQG